MANIIVRGTTPSFIYTCNSIQVSDIATIYLTITQNGTTKIEKDKTSATIDTTHNTVTWKLTQAETLTLDTTKVASVYCKWKLTSDGTVGEAVQIDVRINPTGKDEVI